MGLYVLFGCSAHCRPTLYEPHVGLEIGDHWNVFLERRKDKATEWAPFIGHVRGKLVHQAVIEQYYSGRNPYRVLMIRRTTLAQDQELRAYWEINKACADKVWRIMQKLGGKDAKAAK